MNSNALFAVAMRSLSNELRLVGRIPLGMHHFAARHRASSLRDEVAHSKLGMHPTARSAFLLEMGQCEDSCYALRAEHIAAIKNKL
jgi:hypothetical protein